MVALTCVRERIVFMALVVGTLVLAASNSYSYARPRHSGPARRNIVKPSPRVVRQRSAPVVRAKPQIHSKPGFRLVLSPPAGHVVVSFGGVKYYRHAGLYYRSHFHDGRIVYRIVAPPLGLVVTSVPSSPQRVVINGQVYYRAGSTFYTPVPSATVTSASSQTSPEQTQYVVARPPVGAVVDQLPAAATVHRKGNTTYYVSSNVYYLPIQVGGSQQYVVVNDPM